VAAADARVSATVVASNLAWMRALETASPLGLDRIKMGSNLQSIVREVTLLRERDKYWPIDGSAGAGDPGTAAPPASY
jgi:hypothetical protein